MPVERMTMCTIKDVIRLKFESELSHQQIAAALKISKGVVAKDVSLAAAAGLDWAAVCGLEEAQLAQRLLFRADRPTAYCSITAPSITRRLDHNNSAILPVVAAASRDPD